MLSYLRRLFLRPHGAVRILAFLQVYGDVVSEVSVRERATTLAGFAIAVVLGFAVALAWISVPMVLSTGVSTQ